MKFQYQPELNWKTSIRLIFVVKKHRQLIHRTPQQEYSRTKVSTKFSLKKIFQFKIQVGIEILSDKKDLEDLEFL